MKRRFAIVALAGLVLAGAMAPMPAVVAAEVPAHCAVFPLLKADCRAAIRDAVKDTGSMTVAATSTAVSASVAATDAAMEAVVLGPWHCERTRGGKALFSCSK